MRRAACRAHSWAIGCAKNKVAALAEVGDAAAAAALGRETSDRSARVLGDAHILTISLRAGPALDLSVLGADHPHSRNILERHRPYRDFEPEPQPS
ncbi:hypothetical protein AB5J49_31940 [Streptomyces sp. R28]|uniref:Uncharacterized protein n=1 Tax=Streptomyces sp. R28 TaxID=3238628 RepID=A0AB39Q2X0_9ACTN